MAATPRMTQATVASFRLSCSISRSASTSSQCPVAKRSSLRALCACASRIAVPTWPASSRACPAAAKACSYWSRQPSVTALLICSSRRRSVRAGSAWVTASARSNSGSASVIRPCTVVTSVSTCSAQPMDQLSSASVAAASALLAASPAFSTSPM